MENKDIRSDSNKRVNKLNILYEDNHIIVVEKEAGVLTQGGSLKLPVLLDKVKEYLKIKYNKPGKVFLGMVHRLDTNVGGLVCFARTSKAASRLSKLIREREFERKYLTIVEGEVISDSVVTLTDYLSKDEENKVALVTNKDRGKESILKFKRLAHKDNLSLLEVELITGRFHQIRIQLSNNGTPIYGDAKYGSKYREKEIALYAYSLKFKHPTKDEMVEVKHFPNNPLFKPFNIKQNTNQR